jgi:hypothetical protein
MAHHENRRYGGPDQGRRQQQYGDSEPGRGGSYRGGSDWHGGGYEGGRPGPSGRDSDYGSGGSQGGHFRPGSQDWNRPPQERFSGGSDYRSQYDLGGQRGGQGYGDRDWHGGPQGDYGDSFRGPQRFGQGGQPSWRDPQYDQHDQQQGFDPDYHQWRGEQMRKLDDDYRSWREDRYKKFSDEFSSWRKSRPQGGPGTEGDSTGSNNAQIVAGKSGSK